MSYAYVVDGKISQIYYKLPTVWGKISNFHYLSVEELEPFGFYPIVEIKNDYNNDLYEKIDEHLEFDPSNKRVNKYDIVRKKPEKVPK